MSEIASFDDVNNFARSLVIRGIGDEASVISVGHDTETHEQALLAEIRLNRRQVQRLAASLAEWLAQ